MDAKTESRAVTLTVGGKQRVYDIDLPDLPDWIEDEALRSGGFPYDKKLSQKDYDAELTALQIELVKVQFWMQKTGERVMALFEGRDAAGKGGAIHATLSYMNPRSARVVALTKPTETERGQWYFQRYVSHIFRQPGEFVLFDRSWYNRAGVEPVMGFCTPEQIRGLPRTRCPDFEKLLDREGIQSRSSFFITIGREMQLKRFHERRHDPLKQWKLSPMDLQSRVRWEQYTKAKEETFARTNIPEAVIHANDKRRARVNLIRHMLLSLDYEGKDLEKIGKLDKKIIGSGPDFLK